MRGVIGLALVIVGLSLAWLIIIGKFPPSKFLNLPATPATPAKTGG